MKKLILATTLLLAFDAQAVTSSSRASVTSRPSTTSQTTKVASTAPSFLGSKPAPSPTPAAAQTGLKSNTNAVSTKFGQQYNANNIGQKQAAANTLAAIKPAYVPPKYVPPVEVAKYRTQYRDNTLYVKVRSDRNAYQERSAYYNNPTHIVYVQNSSPSFGVYSGAFLYGMMANAAMSAEYAHNHSNDADYIAWRREADRLAVSNADLKAKLNAMDQQAPTVAAKPVDPNWLPEGVPPAVALSDEALKASQPDINVCVGPQNGSYYKVAQQYLLPGAADVANVVPVITKGSLDIRQKLYDGTCDAGFVQGDTDIDGTQFETVFHPFLETAHLICVKDGAKLGDVKVVNIAQGSGSLMTWQTLAQKSKTLAGVNVNVALSNEDAVAKTLSNKSCLFYVAAPHSSTLNKLFERPEFWLVSIDDPNLLDANYSERVLSSTDYPEEIHHGWFSEGVVKTIAIPVKFVVAYKWRNSYPDVAGKFSLELINMERQIHENAVGQH